MHNFFGEGLRNMIFILIPMFVEAVAIRDFMDITAARKYQKRQYYACWYVVCVMCVCAMGYVEPNHLMEYAIFAIFILASVWVLYDVKPTRMILIALGIIAVRVAFELFFSVRMLELLGVKVSAEGQEAVYTFFINLAPKTTLMLVLKAMRGLVGYRRIKGLRKSDVCFTLLVTFVFIRMFWLLFAESLHSGKVSIWNAYFLTGLIILNISIFHIMNRMQEYYEHETELRDINSRMRVEMENIQAVKETHAKIRRISHGITNHLFAIETLLRNKQYKEAEEYLAKVNKTVEQDMLPIHTNNVVIDAILNQKYTMATSKNIRMHFDIQDLQDCKVDVMAMVSLLSHGLNNAIEACEKVEGDRLIELRILNEERELIISIENTVEQDVVITDSAIPTTKKDQENHGIGLESIKTIVEQFGGQIFLESANKMFKLLIVL